MQAALFAFLKCSWCSN